MTSSGFEADDLLLNNKPHEKFCGLSFVETENLLHNPFGENSILEFRNNISDDTLDDIPFFRIAETLLKIVARDGFIKLTPLGALPKKILIEVYAFRFIPDEFIESGFFKLWKEENCISIQSAFITVTAARLVKKRSGKLTLTKNGINYLKSENRFLLFNSIFSAYTLSFNWSFHDGYPEEQFVQIGWAYSLYLLNQFGKEERPGYFYAEKYLEAFPKCLLFFNEGLGTETDAFYRCHNLRTFERFTNWFGLTIQLNQKSFLHSDTALLKRTELFELIFSFEL